ncbi:hypothetical protein LCGC14_2304730 [marine sediment metagenome]|uniref:NYN domain-containing protein n=1 Tax=marine sediment metagenome TaxID=412755 RepID=A0A0F9EZU1_9ZZZZ
MTTLLVDTTSLYAFHQHLKTHNYNVPGNINYSALMDSLLQKFPQGFDTQIAFTAINPEHTGQQKFCEYLEKTYIVDIADYRQFRNQRLTTRLTYLMGMLVPKPIVIVTDDFAVYHPMLDYTQNRRGNISLAFFQRGLDERWNTSTIDFHELDAKSILGVSFDHPPIKTTGLCELTL